MVAARAAPGRLSPSSFSVLAVTSFGVLPRVEANGCSELQMNCFPAATGRDLTACRQTLRTWTGCFGLQVRRQVRLQVPCLTLRQPDDSLSALNTVRSKGF